MALEVNELVAKLNFVQASRFLKQRAMIEQHYAIPTNRVEEAETVQQIIYTFVKKKFLGCKIRANALTFSLRLDGELHRKVKHIRTLLADDLEWKKWFQDHHAQIFEEVSRHQNPFRNDHVEVRAREGREFLYIPITINKIDHYQQEGVMRMLRFLDDAYNREASVGALHDRVLQLIEGERRRKDEERKRRIQTDKDKYLKVIKENLFRHTGTIDRNSTTFEGKLALRMHDWCTEQGIAPCIANEPTYQRVVPVGINVEILTPNDSDDEGWFAVPTFGGYEIPAERGYAVLDAYGEITGHDAGNTRTRNGAAPIVIQKHLYVQFHLDHWKSWFPERYFEILDVTNRFTEEVKLEVTKAEDERKEIERRETEARKLREAEAARVKLEEQKAAAKIREDAAAVKEAEHLLQVQEEQARIDTLRQQLTAQLVRTQADEVAAEPNPTTFPDGIYRNSRAIPLEKYVVVVNEIVSRASTFGQARAIAEVLRMDVALRNVVLNFHNHGDIVETI